MPAAYDNYDYPTYWKNRDYEHKSEYIAIKNFLKRIPEIERSIEIGAGFGRILPSYRYRVKKIILSDPSAKLISKARNKYKTFTNIDFIQSTLNNLKDHIKNKSFDLCLMIRVLHHINDIDSAFKIIYGLLKEKGYLILEFPNKNHLKANFRNFLKGDFTYPINIFPIDLRSKKHIRNNTLPFINYHPDDILTKLKIAGFEIIETRSVSNIRSSYMKKLFPLSFLLDIENILQIPFSKIYFGPSFFVLAKKI